VKPEPTIERLMANLQVLGCSSTDEESSTCEEQEHRDACIKIKAEVHSLEEDARTADESESSRRSNSLDQSTCSSMSINSCSVSPQKDGSFERPADLKVQQLFGTLPDSPSPVTSSYRGRLSEASS